MEAILFRSRGGINDVIHHVKLTSQRSCNGRGFSVANQQKTYLQPKTLNYQKYILYYFKTYFKFYS